MNTATEVKPKFCKLTPCDSSQIFAHAHCPDTNTLALQFRSKDGAGTIYHYKNYTADDYAAFLRAESKGTFLGQHIKAAKHDDGSAKFPHTKLASHEHAVHHPS